LVASVIDDEEMEYQLQLRGEQSTGRYVLLRITLILKISWLDTCVFHIESFLLYLYTHLNCMRIGISFKYFRLFNLFFVIKKKKIIFLYFPI